MIWIAVFIAAVAAFVAGWETAFWSLKSLQSDHEDTCPARQCGTQSHCECAIPPAYVQRWRDSR